MNKSDFLNFYNVSEWTESERLEWKLSTREAKDIIQTLVAFANKGGGVVVCGVKDDGDVLGQDISDSTLREMTQTVLANTEERLYPEIEKITLDGKPVLVLSITASPLRPHTAYGRPYIRVGASNAAMSQAEYHVMLGQKKNGGGADRDLAPGTSVSDIDEEKLKAFVNLANEKRNANFSVFGDALRTLESLELSNTGTLTKGALLLFGKHPSRVLPQAEFKVAFFKDDKRNIFLAQKTFNGDLFEQFSGILSFAKEHLPLTIDTQLAGDRRVNKIPISVVQELVANAIVHRDYLSPASSYFNIIGSRYLEVINPGALLAPTITAETMHLPHPSIPINRRIARAFFLAGITEQWGEGTLRVWRQVTELGLPPPVWEATRGVITARVQFG